MKKSVIVLILLLLVAGAIAFLPKSDSLVDDKQDQDPPVLGEEFTRGDEDWARYHDSETNLGFEYRVKPEGYVLQIPEKEAVDNAPVKSFVLISSEDYERVNSGQMGTEGPAAITFDVFFPGPNTTPNDWVTQNPRSNYQVGSQLQEGPVVNGLSGVSYNWDGLYSAKSVVVAWKGWIFMLSVSYTDSGSQIVEDFEEFLEYIKVRPDPV